jgi:uncharacterized protein DUF4157
MIDVVATHAYDRELDEPGERTRDRDELAPGRVTRTQALLRPHAVMASGIVMRSADGRAIGDGAGDAIAAAASAGAPLPTTLMRKFEAALGADLSAVRVHDDDASQHAARAVGAKAFAVGHDIHFAAGRYDPSSPEGEHLLAHEVAHTVQQSGGVRYKLELSSPGDGVELEADRAADAMVRGEAIAIGGAAAGVMRAPDPAADPDHEISPLRQQLLDMMKDYDGAVVGDPKFESIIREKDWNSIKTNEAVMQGINIVKGAAGASTTPVPTFTTCIATQGALLRDAFAQLHLKVKGGEIKGAEYSALGHREDPAMHIAKPNDSERPKPGYIIVLGARGDNVNSADRNAKYAESQRADAGKANAKAEAMLKDASQKSDEAKQALEDVKAADHPGALDVARKKQAYDRAVQAVSVAKQLATNATKALSGADAVVDITHAKLDRARQDDLALRDLIRAKYGNKAYQFQHVAYLAGPCRDRPDGRQDWPMFGGGQKVARGGEMKEGAGTSVAIYDPATNELADGDNRSGPNWVQSWINPDDLVDK